MQLTKKPAIAAVTCLALAGGGTGAALLASTADASPATHPAAVEHGTGTASVTVTGPTGKTHTATPEASCRLLKNGDYILDLHAKRGHRKATDAAGSPASTATTVADTTSARKGHRHARTRRDETLLVRHYNGAGSYSGVLRVVRHHGRDFSGHTVKVPVTLTSTGGSFTISKTLSGKKNPSLKGKTVTEKATWTCSL